MQSAALAACLLLLLPRSAVASPRTCSEDLSEHCSSDEAPLIQLRTKSPATPSRLLATPKPNLDGVPWWCPGYPQKTQSQNGPLVAKLGNRTLGWWDLPAQTLDDVPDRVTPFSDFPTDDSPVVNGFVNATTWGLAKAEAAVRLMFEKTKVDPLFNDVPELLRGVFWMKGNGVPEELTVLQYGTWFKEESTYVATVAPFVWAWPAGKPKDAPFGGQLYTDDASAAARFSRIQSLVGTAFSYKFSQCPGYAICHGHDKLGNMSFAYMQDHLLGNVETASNPGNMLHHFVKVPGLSPLLNGHYNGVFTLENSRSDPGNAWRREIHWGAYNPECVPIHFGSYDLVRVMDGTGEPVQPYYDEFVSYMGEVELLMWTGFKSEEAREYLAGKNREFNHNRDSAAPA